MTRLGIRYVAVHDGLYEQFYPRCLARAQAALRGHGFRLLAPGRAGEGLDEPPLKPVPNSGSLSP